MSADEAPPSIIRAVGSHIRQYGLRALAPDVLRQLRATLEEALATPAARDTRLGRHLTRKLGIELARRQTDGHAFVAAPCPMDSQSMFPVPCTCDDPECGTCAVRASTHPKAQP